MNNYLETPPPERAAPSNVPQPPPAGSSSPTGSPRNQRNNGLYNIFLASVGLTSHGADDFSQDPPPVENEEDFWSAADDHGVREGGDTATSVVAPSERQRAPRQVTAYGRRDMIVPVQAGVAHTAPATMVVSGDGDGDVVTRPLSTSRAGLAAGYPGSGNDGLDDPEDYGEESLPRQRRRWMRASSADPSNPDMGLRRPSRRFSLGNPLFRALHGRSSQSGSSTNACTNGNPADGGDSSANAGTRAIERAVNGTTFPGGSRENSIGEGGAVSGAGDSVVAQGRVLFYHKPTLANVPTGDVPDSVPVYLGCPGGGMALGLPLNEAWQGEDHQDTTFNQNLSYTILSWPEDHVSDLLELWRLQVLLSITMIFNILVAALLFCAENPDRTRVEGPTRIGAFPGPFEQRDSSDEPTGITSQEWHLGAVLLIGMVGIVSIVAHIRAGIALYLCLTVVNAILGLSHAPDALNGCRFAIDFILVALGRSYLSKLTYSWVTASAGEARRPW